MSQNEWTKYYCIPGEYQLNKNKNIIVKVFKPATPLPPTSVLHIQIIFIWQAFNWHKNI